MGIKIKQRDITDCGAACLASVAEHYKRKLPVSRIRQIAGTDKRGTNVLGMVTAAERLGFDSKGVKGTVEALPKIPLPAIAHVVRKNLQHYVVIYSVGKKQLIYMDPADGQIHKETIEEFQKIWSGVLILLVPGEIFKEENAKVSIYRRFWFLLAPHKSIVIQSLFGAAVYTILGLSTSIYIQKITDNVFVNGNKNLLNLLSIAMIVILLMQIFIGVCKSVFMLNTGQKIDARLILGYYKHLLKLPQRFFDTMRVGEIISRINDAVKIRVFINDVVISWIVNLFIVIFSFALMFVYSWKLALILLISIPLYIFIYFITNKLNKKRERKLMEDNAELESQLVESLNNALIAADRLFEIMDLERENDENKIELNPQMLGNIRFENVSFSYGTRVDVFENFTLEIKYGEMTAIIGESGSGKTTLAALLQKLYPLKAGKIQIGKTNIDYIENQSLRKIVGAVPQQLNLFAGNVIENIALGEFDPDLQQIVSICSMLGMTPFIEKLPAGLNTYLGENGASLSGGQKQRLAIARALYKNPEILILDEATSSLDSESEQFVQQTIRQLKKQGKTIIIIAHRLSTVVNADNIVVLENGKVIEQGMHNELYAAKGRYFRMWEKQMPHSSQTIQ
jgi:ABC-type bacteriocin/lantibiotic exporter with double-glycine peptidase domain